MSQGTCSSTSLMCIDDGSCKCQKDKAGGGREVGDGMSEGTCTVAGQFCTADGTCKCRKEEAGGADDGDGTTKGTCAADEACQSDGTCSACNVNGSPGDGQEQGTCEAGKCQKDGTCKV